MIKHIRIAPIAASALLLAGCRADLTERLALNPDHTVTVTYREDFDQEMYANVTKLGGSDPFRLVVARHDGWTATSTSSDGHQIVSFSKTVPFADVANARLPDGDHGGPGVPKDGFDFGPRDAFRLPLSFVDSHDGFEPAKARVQTAPALLRPEAVLTRVWHDPDATSALANALSNAQRVDALVSIHLEIKAPGQILATNGTTMPDGSVRWDLHFATSTSLQYVAGTQRASVSAAIAAPARFADANAGRIPVSGSDWSDEYRAGLAGGTSVLAAWQNVGLGGLFDYRRWGQSPGQTDEDNRRLWDFGGGVYVNSAGISESTMDAALDLVLANDASGDDTTT